MPNRLQDLRERFWCQVWRYQYIAVRRFLPYTFREIRQGGYDEGFENGKKRGFEEAEWRKAS